MKTILRAILHPIRTGAWILLIYTIVAGLAACLAYLGVIRVFVSLRRNDIYFPAAAWKWSLIISMGVILVGLAFAQKKGKKNIKNRGRSLQFSLALLFNDTLIVVYWLMFIAIFYSVRIVPPLWADGIASIAIPITYMWALKEMMNNLGLSMWLLLVTFIGIMFLGILSKSNWGLMSGLTSLLSVVLNFENLRLLLKKFKINIKDSERNRQNLILLQSGFIISNIFLLLLITFIEWLTSQLGKPLTFWLYDWINQRIGEKSTQSINYMTLFYIGLDRMIIIMFLALCLLVIVVLSCIVVPFRNELREFWKQCKNFIKTKLDMEPSSTTSDTTSLDDASTTHVTQVEEEKQD